MKKKVFLSFICTIILLAGCQESKPDSSETVSDSSQSEDNTENDQENNAEEITLPDEDLQELDKGDSVQQLQGALIEIGYPIEETSEYDEMTIWAITDIQLAKEAQYINGIYHADTKEIIQELLDTDSKVSSSFELAKPKHPDIHTDVIENPYEILSVANKEFALPADYEPIDLTVPDVEFPFAEDVPKKQLRQEAADALESLFTAAEDEGLFLFAQSGYRSYDRQEAIFAANVEQDGEDHANTYSAKPGESEHQTGLVMDVTSENVNFDLTTDFGDTPEGEWVKNNSHEHGFIIRYPKDKEEITQYQYEPWHLRYVGVKAATEMKKNNQTLEEYLSVSKD